MVIFTHGWFSLRSNAWTRPGIQPAASIQRGAGTGSGAHALVTTIATRPCPAQVMLHHRLFPFAGGAKQFIMSGARMDFHILTGRSVCAMNDQLPNRGREAEMLQEMGLASMEDLFSDIPANVRFDGELLSRSIGRGNHQRYRRLLVPTPTWAPASFLGAVCIAMSSAVFNYHPWRVPYRLHALSTRG